MQWLFRLLTLIALLVAPLAAPAAAAAPIAAAAADCAQMDQSTPSHRMPADHHGAGQSCCIAVPVGIGSPLVAVRPAPLPGHPIFIALAEAFCLGAGPNTDDPPPRTA